LTLFQNEEARAEWKRERERRRDLKLVSKQEARLSEAVLKYRVE
jgi:hypothetical protein